MNWVESNFNQYGGLTSPLLSTQHKTIGTNMPKYNKPQLWVIAPPKDHDIKYLANRDYKLEYIYTEDAGLTVKIMQLRSRSIHPLLNRIDELRKQAKRQIKRGERVTNWIYRGDKI